MSLRRTTGRNQRGFRERVEQFVGGFGDWRWRACALGQTPRHVGLGWIDVHLLASATLAGERVWTRERRLALAARRLGVVV